MIKWWYCIYIFNDGLQLLEPFSPLGAWRQSTRLYACDCTQWVDITCVCVFNQILLCSPCSMQHADGQHADTCGVCDYIVYVCVWLWNLFTWRLSSEWLWCVLCVCVSYWVSGVLDVCLCRAAEAFDDLCEPACSTTTNQCCCLSDIFVRVPFEKVEHIIHRQGHMLSSRPPLLHPHNARCHAHSCQLVPARLPMPITVGQFTFSTHSSRLLCPRCGHMQAP